METVDAADAEDVLGAEQRLQGQDLLGGGGGQVGAQLAEQGLAREVVGLAAVLRQCALHVAEKGSENKKNKTY